MSATPSRPDEFSPHGAGGPGPLADARAVPPISPTGCWPGRRPRSSHRHRPRPGRLAVAAFALIVLGGCSRSAACSAGPPGSPGQELPGGIRGPRRRSPARDPPRDSPRRQRRASTTTSARTGTSRLDGVPGSLRDRGAGAAAPGAGRRGGGAGGPRALSVAAGSRRVRALGAVGAAGRRRRHRAGGRPAIVRGLARGEVRVAQVPGCRRSGLAALRISARERAPARRAAGGGHPADGGLGRRPGSTAAGPGSPRPSCWRRCHSSFCRRGSSPPTCRCCFASALALGGAGRLAVEPLAPPATRELVLAASRAAAGRRRREASWSAWCPPAWPSPRPGCSAALEAAAPFAPRPGLDGHLAAAPRCCWLTLAHPLPRGTVLLAAGRSTGLRALEPRLRVRLPRARVRSVSLERPGPVRRARPAGRARPRDAGRGAPAAVRRPLAGVLRGVRHRLRHLAASPRRDRPGSRSFPRWRCCWAAGSSIPKRRRPANRVLGLVVATGTLLVARDLWHAPEELVSVHLSAQDRLASGALPAGAVPGHRASCAPLRCWPGFAFDPTSDAFRPLGAAGQPGPARGRAGAAGLGSSVLGRTGPRCGAAALPAPLAETPPRHLPRAGWRGSCAGAVPSAPGGQPGRSDRPERGPPVEVSSPNELAARLREDPSRFALIPRSELAAVDDAFAEASARLRGGRRFLLPDPAAGRPPAGGCR